MTWPLALACALSASLHLALVVPRLREPEVGPDEPPPLYATLAPPGDVIVLGLVVLALCGAAHGAPPDQAVVWFGYLGAGAALVWVDLRTTWLPRTLHRICLAQVAVGVAWLAVTDCPQAAAAAIGGVAAWALFHAVWRFSATFGYGDVRLAGLVGAVGGLAGIDGWLLALLCGTALGALWGVGHALRRRGTTRPAHFAYGPALWLGPIAALALSGW